MADYNLRVTSGRIEIALEEAKHDLKTRWQYEWTADDDQHFLEYVKPYIQAGVTGPDSLITGGVAVLSKYIYRMYEIEIPGTESNRWRLAAGAEMRGESTWPRAEDPGCWY